MIRTSQPLAAPITYIELIDIFHTLNILHLIDGINLHHSKSSIELHITNNATRDGILLQGLNIRNHNVPFVPLVRADIIKVFNVPLQHRGDEIDNIITGHGAQIITRTNISINKHGSSIRTGEFHYQIQRGDHFHHIPTVVKLFNGRWIGFRYNGQPPSEPPPHLQPPPTIASHTTDRFSTSPSIQTDFSAEPSGEHPFADQSQSGGFWNQVGRRHSSRRHAYTNVTTTSPSGQLFPTAGQRLFFNRFKPLDVDVETDQSALLRDLTSTVHGILSDQHKLTPELQTLASFHHNLITPTPTASPSSTSAAASHSPAHDIATSPAHSSPSHCAAEPTPSQIATFIAATDSAQALQISASTTDISASLPHDPPDPTHTTPPPLEQTVHTPADNQSLEVSADTNIDSSAPLPVDPPPDLTPNLEDGMSQPLVRPDHLLPPTKPPDQSDHSYSAPSPSPESASRLTIDLSPPIVNKVFSLRMKHGAGPLFTEEEEPPPEKKQALPLTPFRTLTCGTFSQSVAEGSLLRIIHDLENETTDITLQELFLYILAQSKVTLTRISGWPNSVRESVLVGSLLFLYAGPFKECAETTIPKHIATNIRAMKHWKRIKTRLEAQTSRVSLNGNLTLLNEARAEL